MFRLIPRIQMLCLVYIYVIHINILFFTKGVAFFKKLTNIARYLDPHIPNSSKEA